MFLALIIVIYMGLSVREYDGHDSDWSAEKKSSQIRTTVG